MDKPLRSSTSTGRLEESRVDRTTKFSRSNQMVEDKTLREETSNRTTGSRSSDTLQALANSPT